MEYFHFIYKEVDVILDPDTIKSIKEQLDPQIHEISFSALVQTIKATCISPRNIVDFFKKIKEEKGD